MSLPIFSNVQFRPKAPDPAVATAEFEPVYQSFGGQSYSLQLRGWIVGREGPVTAVQLINQTQILTSTPVNEPSPELAERFPDSPWATAARFTLTLNAFEVPEIFRLRVRAVTAAGDPTRVGSLRGVRRRELVSFTPRYQPISLTTIGRTGSTALMRVLSEHPAVVVYKQYPYETRSAKYWLHLLRVLTGNPDPSKMVGQPNQFHLEPRAVGANPFRPPVFSPLPALEAWSTGPYVERVLTFCEQNIDDWYGVVASAEGIPEARYFAEKQFPDEYSSILAALYPAMKEIFLVRDFRDMAASMLAYNALRGTADFGRGQFDSDAEWLAAIAPSVNRLMQAWRVRKDRALLVRYEDLLANPEATFASIFAYLDVDASPATVAAAVAQAQADEAERARHQTSPGGAASVGRWERDLAPDVREVAETSFSAALREFGYVTGVEAGAPNAEDDED